MASSLVYADHASTSFPTLFPPSEEDASSGNPSNQHALGQAAQRALGVERLRWMRLLHAPDGAEILFTSGGTEGNNLVLQGAPWDYIITVRTEHDAVYMTSQFLAGQRGIDVLYLPVQPTGSVEPDDIQRLVAMRPPHECGLISVMYVNNEIGTVQDLVALGQRVAAVNAANAVRRLWFHSDAVQAPGHVPVDVQRLGVDFMTFGAHKFHGPTGVGVLYCRDASRLKPIMFGGHQQRGLHRGAPRCL